MAEKTLTGELRSPRQMLADQEYAENTSIHNDETAERLGFQAGPIEGPTHFSQFVPLLTEIWGSTWFETGCLSSHFQNMCIEGDRVRAFAKFDSDKPFSAQIWAEKEDGTPVLTGTASIPDNSGQHPQTELERRLARLTPPGPLVILEDLSVGQRGAAPEPVVMDFDQNMGALYPFSLREKLEKITECSPWYDPATATNSPWGRAIIPIEMISVLAEYSSRLAKWPTKGPAIGLFADLEIRLFDGPLFVGVPYVITREIVALSESRRTESYWVKTLISETKTNKPKAALLLNHATLKASYAGYPSQAS
jgi:hypothetical protein